MYPGNDGVTSRDFQSTFLYGCKIIFYAYISLMCLTFCHSDQYVYML